MEKLSITHKWNSYEDPQREFGETTAFVGIFIDDYCLTRNKDTFSDEIRNEIHVSLYPLAMWFASSWWRLHYEVLPDLENTAPSHEWRMNHELLAANSGFLWPQILFSADNEVVQVWAKAHPEDEEDSVRFLNGLEKICFVSRQQFSNEISSLIENVIDRLDAVGCPGSDLAEIWRFVLEDKKNPEELKKRRLEASLGFDPEDCPDELIQLAMALENQIGKSAFSELSAAYAALAGNRVRKMQDITRINGIEGEPDAALLEVSIDETSARPWESAVPAARMLRQVIGENGAMDDKTLRDLLGMSKRQLESWTPSGGPKVSVAGPKEGGADGKELGRKMTFAPRKPHPVAQRFEIARLIGDYLRTAQQTSRPWLVSADLSTARQKFQRAFAAELLCPIDSLVEYLDNDFSEKAKKDAANHFKVSGTTVESLLKNNNFLPRITPDPAMPYITNY